MADKPACTIRTRKFLANPLLQRREFILDVLHPGRANVSRADLKTMVAKLYNVDDPQTIHIFGLRTQFGGGKSSGFCLVYDTLQAAKKYEPKYRLIRAGLMTKAVTARKQRKERKNRAKKLRGTKKVKAAVKK